MPYELVHLIVGTKSIRRGVVGLSGSTDGVGSKCQPFSINNLELVDLIFPRWNPLTSWMRQIEDFQRAA
jgi:hypothetical protein